MNINISGLDEIHSKLDYILSNIDKRDLPSKKIIYDNQGLQDLLKISKGKAALLRKTGKISYSQDSRTGKIWYKLSDVLAYLDSCYYERF